MLGGGVEGGGYREQGGCVFAVVDDRGAVVGLLGEMSGMGGEEAIVCSPVESVPG